MGSAWTAGIVGVARLKLFHTKTIKRDFIMLETVNRNILKFSAGRAFFCPACHEIADCRRWVVATQGEYTSYCCGACWDKATTGKTIPASVEVLDGRILFKKGKL